MLLSLWQKPGYHCKKKRHQRQAEHCREDQKTHDAPPFATGKSALPNIEIGSALLGGPGHHAAVRDQILGELRPAIGDAGTKAIADIVQATFDQRSQGRFASIIAWW